MIHTNPLTVNIVEFMYNQNHQIHAVLNKQNIFFVVLDFSCSFEKWWESVLYIDHYLIVTYGLK